MNTSELISKIDSGEITLSYSALKEFAISPAHFVRYKTDQKEQTEAMQVGQLQHTLILQPHLVENKFIFLEKPIPEATWAKTENKAHKEKETERAEKESKILLDAAHFENAISLRDKLYQNKFFAALNSKLIEAEKEIRFDYDTYKWHGFIDGHGKGFNFDLKAVPNASPEKLKWMQKERKFHWQAYLYNVATGNEFGDFFNICYDSDFNITIIKQDSMSQSRAKIEIDNTLSKFKECTIMDAWNEGFEFYTEQGFYLSSEL